MQKHQALIEKVNSFGKHREPFVLIVDFLMQQPLFYKLDELQEAGIEIEFPTYNNIVKSEFHQTHLLKLKAKPFEEYASEFEVVKKHLLYGNSFLTNLTCQTSIETEANLETLFKAAQAKYKIKCKNEWICFSPETFIQIKEGMIHSFPMKGTIDATIANAEQILLHDEKELAEHFTIVDLIRNDLSMVSEKVVVKNFRYITKIDTTTTSLLQVSSHIQGQLPKDYIAQLGSILFSLLPAGSISGAPKTKTLEIIQEAESYDRGYYTGVAFYFDGEHIDSCVLIRFIEHTQDGLVYKSGGGITIHSEIAKEYQELLDKIYVPSL